MRPYRAKRKDNKEWVYGWLLELLDGCFIIVSEAAKTAKGHPHYPAVSLGKYSLVDPATVGQQIIIDDKEFYQGDKLKYSIDGHEQSQPYVIKDIAEWLKTMYDTDEYFRWDEDSIEIIGNIHEEKQ